MTLKYGLTENDFSEYLLFAASKSEKIKKKRKRNWILTTLFFLLLSVIFFFTKDNILMYGCWALGFITLIFYPSYERSQFKKFYQKHAAETFKLKGNEISTVSINENSIDTVDKSGEMKLNLSELKDIVETSRYFYLRLKGADSLIIPKQKIDNLEILRSELQHLAGKLNISFLTELEWKWK